MLDINCKENKVRFKSVWYYAVNKAINTLQYKRFKYPKQKWNLQIKMKIMTGSEDPENEIFKKKVWMCLVEYYDPNNSNTTVTQTHVIN